jgi:CBS domain-containing protein
MTSKGEIMEIQKLRVVDVMTPLPKVVQQDDPVWRAADIMRDLDVGIVPVVSDHDTMRVVGVVTDRDIVIRSVASLCHADEPVAGVMTRAPLYTVEPDDTVQDVLETMRLHKVRRILVTTGTGRLIGIVSQADVILHCVGARKSDVERALCSIVEPAILQR